MTAKAYAVCFLQLQKHAVTFRAGVGRRLAQVSHACAESFILFGDFDFDVHFVLHLLRSLLFGVRACQAHESSGNFGYGQAVVYFDMSLRARGHRRSNRVLRVLNDCRAAELLHRPESRRSVV
jgi:hypothetical protein